MSSTQPRVAGGGLGKTLASPTLAALSIGLAILAGLAMLVKAGRIAWPPVSLLSSIYTITGCLALVGPIVLMRRSSADGGLGDLMWMTGGILFWLFNLAALLKGATRAHAWATPVDMAPMGLIIMAVMAAGFRAGKRSPSKWSWTNVTGWLLGLYWVSLGIGSLIPVRYFRLVLG